MVNVYIKERINDQTTICAGGVTGNTTYLGNSLCALWHLSKLLFSCFFKFKGYSGSGKNNSKYSDRAASSD